MENTVHCLQNRTMNDTPNEPKFNKWGGLLHFGAGRKRLVIAFCALSIMIIAMVLVIKFSPEKKVKQSLYLFSKNTKMQFSYSMFEIPCYFDHYIKYLICREQQSLEEKMGVLMHIQYPGRYKNYETFFIIIINFI